MEQNWINGRKIYQVFIDRFAGYKKNYTEKELKKDFLYGNLEALISKLDYIQSLNFDMIWLTPFFVNQPFGYHGYHSTNLSHVDPRFAFGENPKDKEIGNPFDESDFDLVTKSDEVLIKLINEVHSRGMKFMMDLVPNHVHKLHPFFLDALKKKKESKYFEWFYFVEKKSFYKKILKKEDVDYNYLTFLDVQELPKLNLDHKDCGDYMIKVAKRYLKMGVDAIRLDHIVGPSIEYLKRFRKEIKEEFPTVPLIGEVFPIGIAKFSETILSVPKIYLEEIKDISFKSLEVLDKTFLLYHDVLDGVLDYTFTFLIQNFLTKKVTEEECIQLINKHYKVFEGKNFILIKQLDSHDVDRILFRCNNDRRLFRITMNWLYRKFEGREDPLVMYYGTEDLMTQEKTMVGEPYGDFRVRMPMGFDLQYMKTFFKEKNE